MKLFTVVGARPQFIKAAVVSRAAAATPDVDEVLIHTGQHYDANMSDVFFDELGIPAPTHHLGIGGGGHGEQTGRMLEALERAMLEEQPDWVLVYGDTNSTLAGALAAVKLHIPVAHVEAGLRSFNRRMPEEINRVATDHVSDLLFAPTDVAVRNLEQEGQPAERIVRTGDVMLDAALYHGEQARSRSTVLETLDVPENGFILATVHRAENTDDPARLAWIVDELIAAADVRPVVLPLHPRTRNALSAAGRLEELRGTPGVRLTDPIGYLDMVRLEQAAAMVVTDSGGVQKEAFFHGAPCVTLRDETEWVELVETRWNRLAPPLVGAGVVRDLAADPQPGDPDAAPYGDGCAAEVILQTIGARATAPA